MTISFESPDAELMASTIRGYLANRERYLASHLHGLSTEEVASRLKGVRELGLHAILDTGGQTAAENVAAVFLAVGSHPTTDPLFDIVVGAPLVILAAAPEPESFLQRCQSGESLTVLALEPGGPTGGAEPGIWQGLTIERNAITGMKTLVRCASMADGFIVTGTERGEPTIVLVPNAHGPIAINDLSSPDRLARLAEITFDEAPCKVLIRGDAALSVYASILVYGRLASIAEMTGLTEAALALTVDYAKIRHQFGRPIGSFQAVKHLLAEARAYVHGLESVLLQAVRSVQRMGPEVSGEESLEAAYLYALEATEQVMDVALQVHGGIGYTLECTLSWYYLRAATMRSEWGDPDRMAMHLGRNAVGRSRSQAGA